MEYVLIYIHGFMSSPQSVKAQQTLKYIEEHHAGLIVELPEVPNYPLEAAQMLEEIVSRHSGKKLRFIGSSMGGYMSTYLVEKFGGKAVLINPAVRPFELLQGYLGDHVNPYTNKAFTLQDLHIQQLLDLNTQELQDPSAYWALLQTGDETLDYRQAEQKYLTSRLSIEQGGDHSFQNYQNHLPKIFEFLLS
ncbi:YqiA/YcfP family alpha/beta fold hydrolase [Aliiglaciecola lipolytica]|uniref:Esterase yqiA n=1 Tax=Aliiglaciecola lipolytica E3 TaxID=1127673 RepID=K6Z0D5_9ALTE|nr:YqiA/YcfP family alpha/beta fold hydrolase [Aliiglaciecola lipolytica]GAC16915.1 esterase yqiA [Aliiglaciecola lipolytica E3]